MSTTSLMSMQQILNKTASSHNIVINAIHVHIEINLIALIFVYRKYSQHN